MSQKDNQATSESWEEEWHKEINKLKSDYKFDASGETIVHRFGYKFLEGNTAYTITDWGNIKSFIRELLQAQKDRLKGETRNLGGIIRKNSEGKLTRYISLQEVLNLLK